MDKFNQRKKDILEKDDKSSKGSWDKRITDLCEKINSFDEYYTTSSCSGRVVVLKDQKQKEKGMFFYVNHELVDFGDLREKLREVNGDLKFKQDPPILHVACRDLDSAKVLLEKGLSAGWKRSGIISLGNNIIVELNATEKLEFLLVDNGKLLVNEDFLEKVIGRANENLKKGWEKISELENTFP